jgi:hypothetical protein
LRRPVWALHVFVVGLALHNLVMAFLWDAGVRGAALDVVSVWKEALLAVVFLLAVRARRRLPFDGLVTDWLALVFGAFVVVYAVLPQDWLGGVASDRGVVLGLRHDLLPVAAYFTGRALDLRLADLRRLGGTILVTAAGVAAFGLVDVYAIPLSWWRESGAPGWFRELGFEYRGLSYLPENFVYNTGDERPLRRVVSTFLSPLGTAFLLVVALLGAAAWLARVRPTDRRLLLAWALVGLLFAGLLWTHTRSAYLALAIGLAAYAAVRRGDPARVRALVAASGVAVVLLGFLFVQFYPDIGPRTTYTPAERQYQRDHAAETGDEAVDGLTDASTESHWRSLREGVERVVGHPQGYGLGNAGSTAARTGRTPAAGESERWRPACCAGHPPSALRSSPCWHSACRRT